MQTILYILIYMCVRYLSHFFNFNFLCVVVAGSLNWFSLLVALLYVPKKKPTKKTFFWCRKGTARFLSTINDKIISINEIIRIHIFGGSFVRLGYCCAVIKKLLIYATFTIISAIISPRA